MLTDYHAKLFAHELYRRYSSDNVERFTSTLMESRLDLNPHQIKAAVFAFRSPLTKGAILADEVGLGKTIEAGIVISQKWAERKRKILLIMPASLRKQWAQELHDKFSLQSIVLESGSLNKAIKDKLPNPFAHDAIVISSYQFVTNNAEYVREIDWDLVVIDEAHRLRNIYKKGSKIARSLQSILQKIPKMLLTATPLQNSLLELYGLVSFIDDNVFGDLKSFRKQFVRSPTKSSLDDLKNRLRFICIRTLRRQVLQDIRYTDRKAYTQQFEPTNEERELYNLVADYLRRPNLLALTDKQRPLLSMLLWKLLASSTAAIAPALNAMANRLQRILESDNVMSQSEEDLVKDIETFEELADELDIEVQDGVGALTEEEIKAIKNEIKELRKFYKLATNITNNAKGDALLKALKVGFKKTAHLGGPEKAVIFTESRRTQDYLVTVLSSAGYKDDIVLFNGSNSDIKSRKIYSDWKEHYKGTAVVSGSRSADSRAALVEYFRENAKIMIATEAAAEGINLQFCSMVVNYDLPWNPQRIEQRIGRCHRYGQENDVVVINFLNKANVADRRVYELLSNKFNLFSGLFGASDEVLGVVGSGINISKKIIDIYQNCRTKEEIERSFDALQAEITKEMEINKRRARKKLLENFDISVAEKLNVYKETISTSLSKHEALLWNTTRYMLADSASFDDTTLTFQLKQPPKSNIPKGTYTLKRGDNSGVHYRLQHPLAQFLLMQAMHKELPINELVFDCSNSTNTISILKPLIGKSGLLTAKRLSVSALESEDHIIIAAVTDDGQEVDADQARRFFELRCIENGKIEADVEGNISNAYNKQKEKTLNLISQRNESFALEEKDKLIRWANDKRKHLKAALKNYDNQIVKLKKQIKMSSDLTEKKTIHKTLSEITLKKQEALLAYNEADRRIIKKMGLIISKIEARCKMAIEEIPLFTVGWRVN